MKFFDIIGGKVNIHEDMLGIPCFRKIWESNKDKELARNIISYIIFNNHPDSPYVISMYESDRKAKLVKELNLESVCDTDDFKYAEESYIEFLDTLSLKLLRGLRTSLESISKYLDESSDYAMDMKRVKDILSIASMVDKAIKSINTLEKQVRRDELEITNVRGGNEIGIMELPKKASKGL